MEKINTDWKRPSLPTQFEEKNTENKHRRQAFYLFFLKKAYMHNLRISLDIYVTWTYVYREFFYLIWAVYQTINEVLSLWENLVVKTSPNSARS